MLNMVREQAAPLHSTTDQEIELIKREACAVLAKAWSWRRAMEPGAVRARGRRRTVRPRRLQRRQAAAGARQRRRRTRR